jgi:hypothetical protein
VAEWQNGGWQNGKMVEWWNGGMAERQNGDDISTVHTGDNTDIDTTTMTILTPINLLS